MRQRLGKKKLKKYGKAIGFEVEYGLVRGNTNHRVDLYLRNGNKALYWPKTGEIFFKNCLGCGEELGDSESKICGGCNASL